MRQSDTRNTSIQWPWFFIVIWCALTFSSFYMVAFRGNGVHLSAFVVGPMALLGVYMAWRRVRMALDLKKFGVVSLTPRPGAPARPGGRFVALLRVQDKCPAATKIEAEIRCKHVVVSKGSKGGGVVTEEAVWTSRTSFPLRQSGLGASAEISFDIPSDARPTNLPEDRGGESALMQFRREGGEPQHFHRWEVAVVAQVPGLDLDRGFTVIIEPDLAEASKHKEAAVMEPNSAAPTTDKQGALTAAAPEPRSVFDSKWLGAVVALGFGATVFTSLFANRIFVGTLAPGPAFPTAPPTTAAVAPEPVLPPKTPWITDTSTWSMPMQKFAPYLGIAANGIRRTRVNEQERFSFDEIVIEKNPGRAEVTYLNLRINVTYHDQDSSDPPTIGGFDKGIEDIRGKLTAENPVLVLRNLSVEGSHPKGHIARTRIYLAVNALSGQRARTGGWKQVHEVSRHFTGR